MYCAFRHAGRRKTVKAVSAEVCVPFVSVSSQQQRDIYALHVYFLDTPPIFHLYPASACISPYPWYRTVSLYLASH